MPKIKLLIFLGVISMILNLIISIFKDTIDIGTFAFASISAFVPFVSLINYAFLDFPPMALLFFVTITTLISVIQTVVITLLILSAISNILWSPDV